MSENMKTETRGRRRSPYVLLEESAYSGRGLFKAAACMLAALTFAGVFAAVPISSERRTTVALETAAASAYEEVVLVESKADTGRETPVYVSMPAIEETAGLKPAAREVKSVVFRENTGFSDYVSAMGYEEAHARMEEIRQARERAAQAERERQARIASQQAAQAVAKTSYVRLNTAGIPMSQKSGYVELDEYGVPLHYSYCITGHATAYTADSITSTGTVPVQGTVAVNPRQIPYGTRMWITSADGRYVYGLAVAEDTGGFIYFRNGATVDLFMHSEADCVNWGWRSAKIYILD